MCKLGVAVDQLGCLHEATVRGGAGGAKGGVANGIRTRSCCAESGLNLNTVVMTYGRLRSGHMTHEKGLTRHYNKTYTVVITVHSSTVLHGTYACFQEHNNRNDTNCTIYPYILSYYSYLSYVV